MLSFCLSLTLFSAPVLLAFSCGFLQQFPHKSILLRSLCFSTSLRFRFISTCEISFCCRPSGSLSEHCSSYKVLFAFASGPAKVRLGGLISTKVATFFAVPRSRKKHLHMGNSWQWTSLPTAGEFSSLCDLRWSKQHRMLFQLTSLELSYLEMWWHIRA